MNCIDLFVLQQEMKLAFHEADGTGVFSDLDVSGCFDNKTALCIQQLVESGDWLDFCNAVLEKAGTDASC